MDIPKRLLLATENRPKSAELAVIIRQIVNAEIEVITLQDLDYKISLPEEIGTSFSEIATAKAVAACQATGIPSIGDDSGLCVDALGGAPGIKSRRWLRFADTDNARNNGLLSLLESVPDDKRGAEFVTCVALARPNLAVLTALGKCRGTILKTPRGSNGFGYDPLFFVPAFGKTMAELTSDQKSAISHRYEALKHLFELLSWPLKPE